MTNDVTREELDQSLKLFIVLSVPIVQLMIMCINLFNSME